MKIHAHDRVWRVVDADLIIASQVRYVLGCARCRTTCSSAAKCQCCRQFKTRTAGGSPMFFPDDGKGHRQIMTLADFAAAVEQQRLGVAS